MWLHLAFWIPLGVLFFTYLGYPALLVLLTAFRGRDCVPGNSFQHSALSPQPSALSPQHSALSPQSSALSTQHSALSTQPSALSPQPSALSPQSSVLSPQHSIEPSVSLLVPARNEADHIEAKIRNCCELDYPPQKLEIIVVDDGSGDGTAGRAEAAFERLAAAADGGPLPALTVLRQPRRLGKAAALNRGVGEARGEVLVFSDADSLIAPGSLRPLVRPFANPVVGCVAGRYVPGGVRGANAAGAGFYWRYENFLRRKESEFGGLLGASGALYAVRSHLYEPLDPQVINDDFVVPMTVSSKGYRTLLEPEATAVEDESENARMEFPRRVRIMAGNCEHLWMFRGLALDFGRGRAAFQMFCHKLLRVVSPLWLIVLLAANGALVYRSAEHERVSAAAGPDLRFSLALYGAFLCLQLAFYTLALLGYLTRGQGRPIRIFTLPYYFVMLNAAALVGIYYFFLNRRGLSWGARDSSGPGRLRPGDE